MSKTGQILVLASTPFFSNVIVSNFKDSCVEQVRLWVNRYPDTFNWKPTVEHILKHCEGKAENELDASTVSQREEEARRNISKAVHCDVTQNNVGLDPSDIPVGGFDVITSSDSLAPAVNNQEEFVQALRNTQGVLKEGGYLCALIAGKGTYYSIAGDSSERLPTYYVTEQNVKNAIRDAGLHLEAFQIIHPVPGVADTTELYLCIARNDC